MLPKRLHRSRRQVQHAFQIGGRRAVDVTGLDKSLQRHIGGRDAEAGVFDIDADGSDAGCREMAPMRQALLKTAVQDYAGATTGDKKRQQKGEAYAKYHKSLQ